MADCKDCGAESVAVLECGPFGTPYFDRPPVCGHCARKYARRNVTVRYADGCTDALGGGHPKHEAEVKA